MSERCPCGERFTHLTYDSSRAITFAPSNRTESPLERECAKGHRSVIWMTEDQAREIIQAEYRAIIEGRA